MTKLSKTRPEFISPHNARDRFIKKKRTCLRCNKQFDSIGAGNRICNKCGQLDDYSKAAYKITLSRGTLEG